MSKQEWVYKFDAEGNRIGLVQRETYDDEPVTLPANSVWGWYQDIEELVIEHERQREYRCELVPREKAMLDTEKKILQYRTKSGYCPAEYEETIEHWFRHASGTTGVHREQITRQNVRYVCEQMQRQLASYGVQHMTIRDIIETLNVISAVYASAEAHGYDKPLLTLNSKSHNRIKKSA